MEDVILDEELIEEEIEYKPIEIYDIFKKYCKGIKYLDFKNIINIIKYFFKNGEILIEGFN